MQATGSFFWVNTTKHLMSTVDPRNKPLAETPDDLRATENGKTPTVMMAGHVSIAFDSSQMPNAGVTPLTKSLRYLAPDLLDKSLQGGVHAYHMHAMPIERNHLLHGAVDQIFSINGMANAGSNPVAAFRSSHDGAIGAPLNSLNFSAKRATSSINTLPAHQHLQTDGLSDCTLHHTGRTEIFGGEGHVPPLHLPVHVFLSGFFILLFPAIVVLITPFAAHLLADRSRAGRPSSLSLYRTLDAESSSPQSRCVRERSSQLQRKRKDLYDRKKPLACKSWPHC